MNNRVSILLAENFALRPAPTSERIHFREKEPFVIIFDCQRHDIPADIDTEVIRMGIFAPHGKPPRPVEDARHFGKVQVDFNGFFASCCTVDRINIRAVSEGFCEVYIDCTATRKGKGFDGWSDRYEDFVRSTLFSAWAGALFERRDSRALIRLRDPCSVKDVETRLFFAIKQPIAR